MCFFLLVVVLLSRGFCLVNNTYLALPLQRGVNFRSSFSINKSEMRSLCHQQWSSIFPRLICFVNCKLCYVLLAFLLELRGIKILGTKQIFLLFYPSSLPHVHNRVTVHRIF